MTKTMASPSSSTLSARAAELQRRLSDEDIEASLEECEHLILCDLVERIRAK